MEKQGKYKEIRRKKKAGGSSLMATPGVSDVRSLNKNKKRAKAEIQRRHEMTKQNFQTKNEGFRGGVSGWCV